MTQNQQLKNQQLAAKINIKDVVPGNNAVGSPNEKIHIASPSNQTNECASSSPNNSTGVHQQNPETEQQASNAMPEIIGPRFIQAPVQIRIEDLHADCSVHRVKIIDTVPPLGVFDLDEEFMYRLFIKYKYPSIFVQALFVLHFGSFRAMHLNTSARVKNNLELIPENFVNSLTVLVLKWFPAVDDLDFGKCLNQKQRSILSAARSCLFFKKCDACKQRDIDSLPSTYSVKNLTLMAAQHNLKREASNQSASISKTASSQHPVNVNDGEESATMVPTQQYKYQVFSKEDKTPFPTPPLSDSLSPVIDMSDSINSVFEQVNNLVNMSEMRDTNVKQEAISESNDSN